MSSTSQRRQLPNRRPNDIHEITVGGQRYLACVGFYDDGTPGELFLDGVKPGSAMAATLQDAAIAVSLALQYGTPPGALAKSMSRQPSLAWTPNAAPASVIGAALDLLARLSEQVCRELADKDATPRDT